VSTVNDTVSKEQRRTDAARERLRAALDPQSDTERLTVEHLAVTMPRQASTLLAMVNRAIARATADGYERGWSEAGGVQ
jgi:hypothetical protein